MYQLVLSKPTRQFLIKHMAEVEEEREVILKEYFPKVTVESMEFEKFIGSYITSIEEYVKCAQINENEHISIPFALIGSMVEIQDLYDREVEKVRIISPFINQGQINYVFASYLSPLGKGLLLKKKGDTVEINVPAGVSRYIINDVAMPNA